MGSPRAGVLRAALALSLALASPARAAYEEVGVGARVTGLGGVFTAVADDVYALHYNPAGLGTLARPELTMSYSKLLMGLSDKSNLQNSFLAYVHPLRGGRSGTLGLGWNYFTLDSLYRENSVYLSYGRELPGQGAAKRFYGGLNAKYLSRSLGTVGAATQPIGNTGAVQPGVSDPVLQSGSKGNLDLDLGLLYRPKPRWTLGLAVQHVLEPNVAFASGDTDKLGRNVKIGGSYKTPFSTLGADVGFLKAADGSLDKQFSLAAEKWLPTLLHGTFGVRGALGVGTRSYRQLGAGLSYKVQRMQFDYGFTIPMGGISGIQGTHRLGLTFRFGQGRAAEARIAEALLENMSELAEVGTPEFKYQMEDLAQFKRDALEELLRQVKEDVSAGRFADALEKLDQASALKKGDPKLEGVRERLSLIATLFPEVKDFSTDPAQAALYEGVLDFLSGKGTEALRKVAYAQSLNPSGDKFKVLMAAIEGRTGAAPAPSEAPTALPAPPVAPVRISDTERMIDGNMALMEVALRQREYDRVLTLASRVIELDPGNALAYKRMGSAYYGLRKYPDALRSLRLAYKFEQDAQLRNQLRPYIDELAALVEKKARETAPRPAAEPAKAPAAEKRAPSPQELERLYESGVELYAQGRLSEAAAMFKKILDLEPGNPSARRAYDRVQNEILRGERR